MKKTYHLIILCLIFLSYQTKAAAILNFDDDGYLTSILNFSFQNKTYDVVLADGNCAELYNGCTNSSLPFPHNPFSEHDEYYAPVDALFALRTAIAQADTRSFDNEYNRFYLRNGDHLAVPWKENYLPNSEQSAQLVDTYFVYMEQGSHGGANDYVNRNSSLYNYTIWTEVPEPSAYTLLLLGMLALFANANRARVNKS
jgi:hypothetical protein